MNQVTGLELCACWSRNQMEKPCKKEFTNKVKVALTSTGQRPQAASAQTPASFCVFIHCFPASSRTWPQVHSLSISPTDWGRASRCGSAQASVLVTTAWAVGFKVHLWDHPVTLWPEGVVPRNWEAPKSRADLPRGTLASHPALCRGSSGLRSPPVTTVACISGWWVLPANSTGRDKI